MKRRSLALLLAFAMIAAVLPMMANAAAGEEIFQETFESWTQVEAPKDFASPAAGNMTVNNAGRFSVDAARYGADTNKSIKLNSASGAAQVLLNMTQLVQEDYVLAFDLYAEDAFVSPGEGKTWVIVQPTGPSGAKKPLQLSETGQFLVNGGDIGMTYQQGHWYHVEVQVTAATDVNTDTASGSSTTVTVTDQADSTVKFKTFLLKEALQFSKWQIAAPKAFGTMYLDNLDLYKGEPKVQPMDTPTIVPGTDVENPPAESPVITPDPTEPPVTPPTDSPDPVVPAAAYEQQTFETWVFPGSGASADFADPAKGNYSWSGPVTLDEANDGTHQNKSIKLDGTAENAMLKMNLTNPIQEAYTLAFDFYGTGTVTTESRFFILNGTDGKGYRPLQIKGDQLLYNGNNLNLAYAPNHWYHVELAVSYNPAADDVTVGNSAVVTVTDLTTSQTASSSAYQQKDAVSVKNFQFGSMGFTPKDEEMQRIGVLYFDNIDLYTGAPDDTRLDTPLVAPGATPPAPEVKTYVQQTFETWTFPGSGSTADFEDPAVGNYKWTGAASIDSADDGTHQNKALLLDGTSADAAMKLELKNPINSDYTFAFDFFGTNQVTEGRLFFVNGPSTDPRPEPAPNYQAKSGRPVQVDGDQFKYNGNTLGMEYHPGRWYHIELSVTYNPASDDIDQGQKAVVKVTDLTTGETKSSPAEGFDLKSAMNVANFQLGPVTGGGTRLGAAYFDNIDFYQGEPDDTRIAAPQLAPGTTPGKTYIEETFETWTFPEVDAEGKPITKPFDGGEYGWGVGRPPVVDAADNGIVTNKSLGLPVTSLEGKPMTFFTASMDMAAPITEKHTVSFDFYPQSAPDFSNIQGANPALMELFKLDITKIQVLEVSTEGKFMIDNVNQELPYTPGHWYHVDVTLDPAGNQTVVTLTDTNTKDKVTATIAKPLSATNADPAKAGPERIYRFANQDGFGTIYYDNLTIYDGEVKSVGLPTPQLAPGTQAPRPVEAGETVWQETFEGFEMPSGTKIELPKGSVTWMSGRAPVLDEAWNTRTTNTSAGLTELAGGTKVTQLNINLELPIPVSHTLAFDWYGEQAAPGAGAIKDNLEVVRLSTGKRPVMISPAGQFQINGKDAMAYEAKHWYHIEIFFDMTAGPTATVKIQDLTEPSKKAEASFVIADQANNTFFRMANQLKFGTYYVDNIDLYASAPDNTRLETPPFAPGTQMGQKPGSGDYYVDINDADTTGITIKKNIDTEDDRAVLVAAVYDENGPAPSLHAVTSKELTLKTGETVTVAKADLPEKPADGTYSVRYYLWKLDENGETLQVLVAINGL